jgi:hypothetical protein
MLRQAVAGCTGLTLRVNMAVDTVTTTGRCTSAHSGMLTCMTLPHHVISSCGPGTINHPGHVTQATTDSKNADASRRGSQKAVWRGVCKPEQAYLGSEHRKGHEGAEEAQGHPVRSKLADAKVAQDELKLGAQWQRGRPDVHCRAAPQLHGATRPAVLLLAVRIEAGRQLHMHMCRSQQAQCRQSLLPVSRYEQSAASTARALPW